MDFFNQFQKIKWHWLRRAGLVCGQDVLNDKFKIHFYSVFVQLICLSAPVSCFWTILFGEPEFKFKAFGFMSPSLQYLVKCSSPYKISKNAKKSLAFLENVYKANLNSDENWSIFHRFIGLLNFCSKYLIFHYVFWGSFCGFVPFIKYLHTGRKDLFYPFHLPETSRYSWTGYTINMAIQPIMAFQSVFYYLFHDMLFLILILHVILLVNILRNKIRAIEVIALQKQSSHLEITANFRNILLLHKEILT